MLGEGGADPGPGGGDRGAQRQVESMRSRSCRALRVMRRQCVGPGSGTFRSRSAPGRGCRSIRSVRPGDQIGCGHDDFEPGRVGVKELNGSRLARWRWVGGTRSSTRACWRWRNSRPEAGPRSRRSWVVRNPVTRCPSASVNRSCAPGCGRSLCRISRVPAGHFDRSMRSVAFDPRRRRGCCRRPASPDTTHRRC